MILIPHEQSEVPTLDIWRHLDFIHHLHVLVCLYTKLHLKAHDDKKFNFCFPWYGPRMYYKAPPNFKVTALGYSANWLSTGYTAVYKLVVGWDDECIWTNLTLHRIVKVSFPCQFVIHSISDTLEHPPRNALRLALQTIKCNQTPTSHISKLSHYPKLPPLTRPQSLQFPTQISKKNWQQSWLKLSHWSCRTYPGRRLPLG